MSWGLAAFALSVLLNYVVLTLSSSTIRVGIGTCMSLLAIDLGLLMWIWTIRPRLPQTRISAEGKTESVRASKPVHPLVAARSVALAMASSRAGALASGVYLGVAVVGMWRLSIRMIAESVAFAGVAAALSLLLVGLALWLERMCTLPPSAPEDMEVA